MASPGSRPGPCLDQHNALAAPCTVLPGSTQHNTMLRTSPGLRSGQRRLDQHNATQCLGPRLEHPCTAPWTAPWTVPWTTPPGSLQRDTQDKKASRSPFLDCALDLTWINATQCSAQVFAWTAPPISTQRPGPCLDCALECKAWISATQRQDKKASRLPRLDRSLDLAWINATPRTSPGHALG